MAVTALKRLSFALIDVPAQPAYHEASATDPEVVALHQRLLATEYDGYCRHGVFVAGLGRDIPCAPCEAGSALDDAIRQVSDERDERAWNWHIKTLMCLSARMLSEARLHPDDAPTSDALRHAIVVALPYMDGDQLKRAGQHLCDLTLQQQEERRTTTTRDRCEPDLNA